MASGFPDWLRAFSMLGKYGTEYKVVAVTEEGNLYVLLQGEDADEVLRTVRLDDEGRLSAFVIDSVDAWSRMLSIGNAELAVRLGAPHLYDQRGRTVFVDSFEHGLQRWDCAATGAGSVVASPTACVTGGYSCKLTAGEDAADHYAVIEGGVGAYPASNLGFACRFSHEHHFETLDLKLFIYDGVKFHTCGIRVNDTLDKLQYYNSGGGWTSFADYVVPTPDTHEFHWIKFVIDPTEYEYVRAFLDNVEEDISGNAYETDDSNLTAEIIPQIKLIGHATDNDVAFIDDIILTTAEP